jgi:hypothetical protein
MTDEISEGELERRMRAALFGGRTTKVETRRSGARNKIDPSDFKQAGPAPAPAPAPRPVREVPEYVVHMYSPEYDDPFWRIYRVGKGGKLTIYLNCESDAELEDCISKLEASGAKVRRLGHD